MRVGDEGTLTDFALLRLPAQSGGRALSVAPPGRPLTPVVASGFPGLHLGTDPIFARLREGDADASRDLVPVLQSGVVNHLQRYEAEAVTLVLHSAEIAPGNSGGPLVDYCGRVVGVNTFGRTDEQMPVTARYALGSDGLLAFLTKAGIAITPMHGPATSRRRRAWPPPRRSSRCADRASRPASPARPPPCRRLLAEGLHDVRDHEAHRDAAPGACARQPKLGQQYEQLIDLLARRLSPAHAGLFAERCRSPWPGPGGRLRVVLAYEGDVRRVTELDPQAAGTLRAGAAKLEAEIAAFADGLEREGDASRDLARLLRDALVVPDADHLWSVDGHPVLVAWGYRLAGAEGPVVARGAAITASAASAGAGGPSAEPASGPAATTAAAPVWIEPRPVDTRRRWLGPVLWLVFVLLTGVLADRLLRACALGDDTWPSWIRAVLPQHCPVPSVELDPDGGAILAAIRTTDEAVRGAELAVTRGR